MIEQANDTVVAPLVQQTEALCREIVSFAREVSRLHRMKEKQMVKEYGDIEIDLLWQMLNASPVFAVEVHDGDDDPVFYKTTHALEVLFDYRPGELHGQPISILIPPEKREIHKKYFSALMRDPHDRQMGAQTTVKPEGMSRHGLVFPIELSWKQVFIDRRPFLIATVMRQLKTDRDVKVG
jgi:PAS domain S-box-containing protein